MLRNTEFLQGSLGLEQPHRLQVDKHKDTVFISYIIHTRQSNYTKITANPMQNNTEKYFNHAYKTVYNEMEFFNVSNLSIAKSLSFIARIHL